MRAIKFEIMSKAAPVGCREEGFKFQVFQVSAVLGWVFGISETEGPPVYPHEDVSVAIRILKW